MVDVVDLLHPVVLLQGDGVEATLLAHRGEGRLEAGEGLDGRAGPHVLVTVEDDEAVAVAHGHHGPLEAAVLPRGRGELLRPRGEGVDVAAGEAAERGDQVGADALGDEVDVEVGHRVREPRAAVGADGDAGHRLHAAGQDEVLPAGTHLGGGEVDGLQARRAEAVLLDACHGVREPGRDGGDAGDVGALVAEGADDAEHDVVDGGGVEVRQAAAQLVDEADDEVDGLGAVQRAVGLAAPARGADRLVHVRFGAQGRMPFGGREGGRCGGQRGQDSRERPMISFMISVVPP